MIKFRAIYLKVSKQLKSNFCIIQEQVDTICVNLWALVISGLIFVAHVEYKKLEIA